MCVCGDGEGVGWIVMGTQFTPKMRQGREKKCRALFVINVIWFICTIAQ